MHVTVQGVRLHGYRPYLVLAFLRKARTEPTIHVANTENSFRSQRTVDAGNGQACRAR